MLVKNARAFVDGKFTEKDILIDGNRIASVAKGITCGDDEIVDARGLIALPGLIEIHAHLREPGQTQKEDFLSGSLSAASGGYCLVYDMPNNTPKPTITSEALEEKKRLAKKAVCEIRFHFGATQGNFEEVRKANPESLKIYMGKTTGSLLVPDSKSILAHMKNLPANRQIFVHAQDQGILDDAGDNENRTIAAAQKGAKTAVGLAREANRKVHIPHVSSAGELGIVQSWKLATMDTCPQYLFLTREQAGKIGPQGRWSAVNPPLRSRKVVEGLWKKLNNIDAIATDHAPHLAEDKERGAQGLPGLETALSLFLDAHSKGRISLEWIARRFSENPAKIMGLPDYGKIKKGYIANLTLIDLKKEWVVEGGKLATKCRWSPFEGIRLKGRAGRTICSGRTIYELQE